MSITTRLLISFAAVIFVVAGVTVGLATRATTSEFRHVMLVDDAGRMQMIDAGTLQQELAASYADTGGWQAAAEIVSASGAHMRMMGGSAVLAAPDGQVIAGAPSGRLAPGRMSAARPIIVDGAVVGLLAVDEVGHAMGPGIEEIVGRVQRGVWLAALVAGALAFGLSLASVRAIGGPLGRVSAAATAVAAGDLTARAPVAGTTEVRSVAEAFNHMADSLGRQASLRRAMLADIAHELRTPLAVMQAQVEALTDGIFPPTSEHLGPLLSQTEHLTRLVADLHTLSHVDAGELELVRQPVALAALAADLVAGLTVDAEAKGVAVVAVVPDDLPPLDADPVRLRQVLGNLLSNAVRHTPGGSVRIEVARHGETARFTVADTGEGIGPDDLPHIFERFYRADRSRSRSSGGTGLGLAIARRLTEAHGGIIDIVSRNGKGTTATVSWPLVAPKRATPYAQAEMETTHDN